MTNVFEDKLGILDAHGKQIQSPADLTVDESMAKFVPSSSIKMEDLSQQSDKKSGTEEELNAKSLVEESDKRRSQWRRSPTPSLSMSSPLCLQKDLLEKHQKVLIKA